MEMEVESESESEAEPQAWEELGDALVPCVLRAGERYCSAKSIRSAVNFLVSPQVFDCASMKGVAAAADEVLRLAMAASPGADPMRQGDPLLRMSEARDLLVFLQRTHAQLAGLPGPCGLVKTQDTTVPYVVVNNEMLAPVAFLESVRGFSSSDAPLTTLDGWPLSYVRFCCKVAGLDSSPVDVASCSAVSLRDVDVKVNEFWPNDSFAHFFDSNINGSLDGEWQREEESEAEALERNSDPVQPLDDSSQNVLVRYSPDTPPPTSNDEVDESPSTSNDGRDETLPTSKNDVDESLPTSNNEVDEPPPTSDNEVNELPSTSNNKVDESPPTSNSEKDVSLPTSKSEIDESLLTSNSKVVKNNKFAFQPRRSRTKIKSDEDPAKREERLLKMRLKQAERIANETPKQRSLRLRKLREYQAWRRTVETAEERQKRLLQLRINQSKRLKKLKTEEQLNLTASTF